MIPAEGSELELFTPPCLANVAEAPVFKLRPATKRAMRDYRYAMQVEGLQYHSKEAIRAEALRALEALYSPEQFAAVRGVLLDAWLRTDQNIPLAAAEQAEIDDLTSRLIKAWKPLAVMSADNRQFFDESLRIALSLFLIGWSGLDLAFRFEMNRVPLDLLDEVEEALRAIEAKAIGDKVAGVGAEGLAFLQLCTAAQGKMGLSKEQEKNSDSPPSSQPVPNGSTTPSSSKTAGVRSKASARSGSKKG
ncbi:MAG TPA: hypothetical protein VFW19_10595 [Allosphingosinicella sp.]|nr:hypothetical protein [Allosphingosinicella sp.]